MQKKYVLMYWCLLPWGGGFYLGGKLAQECFKSIRERDVASQLLADFILEHKSNNLQEDQEIQSTFWKCWLLGTVDFQAGIPSK